MMRWLLFVVLLPGVALAQTHVKQPFSFLWDYASAVDRFELKLDAGAYTSVGLPPASAGTYTLKADSALTGAHSAVVRACTVALGCSPDSNSVAFVVDVPAPAPVPAAPTGLKLVAGVAAPPGPVESPSGTTLTAPGSSIIDSLGAVWTLGPPDASGFPVKMRNGVIDGTAVVLCYSGRSVNARGDLITDPGWWKWTDNAALAFSGSWSLVAAPAGC